MFSQPPIVHRAGLLMRICAIYLRDTSITSDHFQFGVSRQLLQGKKVTPIPKVVDRECMPEFVWIHLTDASPLTNASQEFIDHKPVHWARIARPADDKDGIPVSRRIEPRGKIFPKRLRSSPSYQHDPLLAPFAYHLDATCCKIYIANFHLAQL